MSKTGKEAAGIGSWKRIDERRAHHRKSILGSRAKEAADDVHRLVNEESVFKPVDGGRAERRGVAEAHGAANGIHGVRTHSGVNQRIKRKLHGKIEILVFPGVYLARESDVARHAGVEVAQQPCMRWIRTLE